jgi:hypothetical protein
MLLRELINQTVVQKDEIKQRRTICQMGLLNAKEDLRETTARHKNELASDAVRITEETDFKSMGLTNQKQRDQYIFDFQKDLREQQKDIESDLRLIVEQGELREKELYDEYTYYEDRLAMLMKIYDIEGEIELEDIFIEKRQKITECGEDDKEEPTS